MRKSILFVLFSLSVACIAQAQVEQQDRKAIQFSGMVVTEGVSGEPEALPYTSIAIKGTSRGTISDSYGFFSFVALAGDTVVFSRIGYATVEKQIPDSLKIDRYSWQQIMSSSDYLLPEAVIFPWPSREHFKFDFLAIDVSNELRAKAEENLAREVLEELSYTIPVDGRETYSLELDRIQTDYKYAGQFKPQNIFSPVAWKQFIDAWRRGDFKKKKDKKDRN
jgi:hypothetical protein